MKRYIYISISLVFALIMGALLTTGALAQGDGHSGYLHAPQMSSGQVGEPTGTYVWSDGSPAPGYATGSDSQMASTHNCGQTGSSVWNQGSLAPANPCLGGGVQTHCAGGPAACPGHPGHESCG